MGDDICQLEVAIPLPLHGTFTYKCDHVVTPGTRVLVPFGARKIIGVVMEESVAAINSDRKLKKIIEVLEDSPSYSMNMLKMARWMSRYYLAPLGEVLRTMLPASRQKMIKKKEIFIESKGLDQASLKETAEGDFLAECFKTKKFLSEAVFKKKLKAWPSSDLITAERLIKNGFISEKSSQYIGRKENKSQKNVGPIRAVSPGFPLTPEQSHAVQVIKEEGLYSSNSIPFLLWGVTGSGKTEVYLKLFDALGESEQALMLVPEISLTPQMTARIGERFPGQVAVVHSNMTESKRWLEMQKVVSGEAKILLGPRSAVFCRFRCLKLIVVDEEHDGSYKQNTGVTYNGRDIAILRSSLEDLTVVLGSATPSLESWYHSKTNKYRVLSLKERPKGSSLPAVDLLRPPLKRVVSDLSDQVNGLFSTEIIDALKENQCAGHQAIVIVNRRGYASFLLNLDDNSPLLCPSCSISLTVHDYNTELKCHYCGYTKSVNSATAGKGEEQFKVVGYGSQQAEHYLKHLLPGARVCRIDSDSMQKKGAMEASLSDFKAKKIDILVGTQILAKGHDFPNVTLVILLEVDQTLNLPDFRAGERGFQLLVQSSGRAGRAELAGKVMIQTFKPDHAVLASAMLQDYESFAMSELKFREDLGYPPYGRMIAIDYSSRCEKTLDAFNSVVKKWWEEVDHRDPKIAILGPADPPISLVRGRYRKSIFMKSHQSDLPALHESARGFQAAFSVLPKDIRMTIDVDPQSLL